MNGRLRVTLVGLCGFGLACGSHRRGDAAGDPDVTGDADGAATVSVDSEEAGDVDQASGTATTGGTQSSSSGDSPPPKFDLSMGPDAGPRVPAGIPDTCARAEQTQSTVGCSFRGNRMQNNVNQDSSIAVGNVSVEQPASVQLFFSTKAGETEVGDPIVVAPLASHEFVLSEPTTPVAPGGGSILREAGTYRVQSDFPIVAYQHSPIGANATNDSSMLIPDHALGQFYIVASWGHFDSNLPSSFNVIGVHDDTTVTWKSWHPTLAGVGVAAAPAFGLGTATLNNHDLLQVASSADASGTVVETDKPAWVVGAVPCAQVPIGLAYCDHLEELLIPVEYWGTHYVGAHAPQRGSENYWWRVYSGADAVTVTTTPPQPGTPATLDRGEFIEFSTLEHVVFEGDGAFMPVQYLEGQHGGAGTGDPAAYQMVPSEQLLNRYVFVTGTGYDENYAQIIRSGGGAEVTVDDVIVTGYTSVGEYEVADWSIAEGAHSAQSDEPFAVVQVGYTDVTSYAYPGGLALGFINDNPAG